jgi:hypothetical protein
MTCGARIAVAMTGEDPIEGDLGVWNLFVFLLFNKG